MEDFPDQNFYRNSGKTSRSGIESEINFKVNQKLKLNLISTIGNYKFVKYEVNGQDFSNNRIAGLPKNQHVFNLNYSLTKKINLILDFKIFGNDSFLICSIVFVLPIVIFSPIFAKFNL